MYAKRVQIVNYGPIGELDIEFPFDGDVPKPVVMFAASPGQLVMPMILLLGAASKGGVPPWCFNRTSGDIGRDGG